MNYTRIINDEPTRTYSQNFIDNNDVDGWVFASEYSGNYVLPKWNGTEYYESATLEEIAEANKPIVPSTITARQLRLQLVLNGFDLNTIDLIIDSLPEPNKSIAKVSWEYATTFEREHQMLALIAQQLGITETELDTIFINAEKL